MLTIFLIALVIFCAINWFARYIGTAALLWYIQEKGLPLPSDEDLKQGTAFVTEHMFKRRR